MKNISFNAELAGISVGISCPSEAMKEFCADYLCDRPCEMSVEVTQKDIEAERDAVGGRSDGLLCEISAVQRRIAEEFPLRGRFLMHGAAITYKGYAYMFCAPSGGGKSTHIRQWKKHLQGEVDIINGDKPFLSLEEEGGVQYIRVHGSPWAGKEFWQKNRSAPLRAICFISQSSQNGISRLRPEECLPRLMRQVYVPRGAEAACRTLELTDKMVSLVPLYHLCCDVSEAAVRCCFEAVTGDIYTK